MACFLSAPLPRATSAVISKCTQSATATVRIITGAPETGGETGIFSHDPKPMAVAADSAITMTVANVPANERVAITKNPAMMKYISGVRVDRSDCAASENDCESICDPVSSKRILGYFSRISARKSRAACTILLVAIGLSRGGRSETNMAPVRASCDRSRPTRSGSFKIVSST